VGTSVSTLMASAGLSTAGVVRWGDGVPLARPGVYIVAMTDSFDAVDVRAECPISEDAVKKLLDVRPELTVDGVRPTGDELAARISAMWLSDETIVYVGLAGTSVAGRVDAYYRTKLGARRPHAGGWPIKTLNILDELWVHFAPCETPADAEEKMLRAFTAGVSDEARHGLVDPTLPIPFANLEITKRERKKHGIEGSRESRRRLAPRRLSKRERHPGEARASRSHQGCVDPGGI
jgi:hypothetical protein